MTVRVFDRIPSNDPRSAKFPIRTLLDTTQPRGYTWRIDQTLDQGSEGACVGFAWTHCEVARPKAAKLAVTNETARDVYHRAQQVDQWEGAEPTYSGTSVLAGAKIALENGWISEYRWAYTLKDALAGISRHGPAVLGVDWYEGMFDPDSNGLLHVSGEIAGGHAILATGVSVKNKTITLHNSWGPDWGVNGNARLSWDDFEKLIHAAGDVCLPVKTKG